MKTTRFFAAAIALLSVLSCQKEEQQNINNSENEGGAIITCTFASNDAATKTTTTDGKTPLWAAGDKIMLYDGVSGTQELTLAASGTASSTTGVIDGTDATKFTFVKPSGWTNVYAIYPSRACVSGFSASAPKINFAGQDGAFGKANICAAAEVSGMMSFKNVGAILKFTSKSVKASKVVVPVAGLANNFTVSFSGATPSLASESASNSNEFSVGTGSGAVYIGIPAESIAASSVFTYKTSADATLGTYTTGAANTVEVNKIYNLGAMMGTLPGVFTVSAGADGTAGTADDVKVQFSKGNLQATVNAFGSPTAWNFTDDQYGYIGNAAANTSIGTTSGVVDLFGWSTDAAHNNWGIHTKTEATEGYTTGDFKDWGKNAITNGGNKADVWRTLSSDEWNYLLNTYGDSGRTDANRFAKGNVMGIKGLIVFPDGYTGTTSGEGIAEVNKTGGNIPSSSIEAATWTSMESAGCVFLPTAGYRVGSSVYHVASIGICWSYTPYGTDRAYSLYFDSDFVDPVRHIYRSTGYSVRLVCAAQ